MASPSAARGRPSTKAFSLIARDAAGARFGVAPVDLAVQLVGGPVARGSIALLRAIPVGAEAEQAYADKVRVRGVAAPAFLLGESIQRFHPKFGRIQGVVSALRGAVKIEGPGQEFYAFDLLEVNFDPRTGDTKEGTPPLSKPESGALVSTWNGVAIGLLVAGKGHTGFVVPVADFLKSAALTVESVADGGVSDALIAELEAGRMALSGDLAREPGLDLDLDREAA